MAWPVDLSGNEGIAVLGPLLAIGATLSMRAPDIMVGWRLGWGWPMTADIGTDSP
jgi:hypothetical protein